MNEKDALKWIVGVLTALIILFIGMYMVLTVNDALSKASEPLIYFDMIKRFSWILFST